MVLLGLPMWIVLVFLFLFGAVAGSFLNVCIHRLPQSEKFWLSLKGLWSPPSRCPYCYRRIPGTDNIPIVGWLKIGGRCRFCKTRISPRYPLIELFNALLFVTVYWFAVPADYMATIQDSGLYSFLGPQGDPGSWWLSPVAVLHWRYAYHMVLLEALVVATFIDFDERIIPDTVTLPTMAVGLVGGAVIGQVHLVPLWFQSPEILRSMRLVFPDWMHFLLTGSTIPSWFSQYPHLHGFLVSLAGLIVGGGIIWGVRIIGHWVLKQEAMGFGDVTLMAAIGSFLGWQPTVIVFFLAPICALLVVILGWVFRREREIPYGPYLSLATLIVLLGWQQIWPTLQRVFELGPLLIFIALLMGVMLFFTLQLTQVFKRLLGIPTEPDWGEAEWTSADQLHHFAGEKVDLHQGLWRREEWPGTQSGRGRTYVEQWKNGHP